MGAESFTAIYKQYYRLILTVAEQRLQGRSDAEDVTAEVFRIAWNHDASGNELSLPWLYQVLRNVIGNEYRRTARSGQLLQHMAPLLSAHAPATGSDVVIDIRRAMNQLPPDDREVLYMTYWEDLSGQEIASILDWNPVTVRVRLMRARRKLKAALDRLEATRKVVTDG